MLSQRHVTRIGWFMVLLAATAVGQTSVSVPALVIDGSGHPVHGLQKSDFELRSGKNVSLDSVEDVPPLKLNGFAEPVPVFILFDAVDMPVPNRAEMSQILLSYLRKAADDHLPVTVLAFSAQGIWVIHDMATDPSVFAAAMDRVLPQGGKSQLPSTPSLAGDFSKAVDDEATQIERLTKPMGIIRPAGPESFPAQQLESLRMVGKMLQQSRKRKLLIWISARFPVYVQNGTLMWHSQAIGSLNSAYQAAINALNGARMSVYPLPMVPSNDNNADEAKNGLEELARRTGGKLLSGNSTENFVPTMADLCKHFDSYYILNFTMQPARKPTWIDSTIKVSKPETKITAAEGFFSIPQ